MVGLRLGAGSELARVTLVEEAAEALNFSETLATLEGASRLSSFVLLLGGRTVRHEATVRSEGEKSRCDLNGAFLLSGRQEANILTTVDHVAPGGETREMFKGVVEGRAHGVFLGRIAVRPDAQNVDAQQVNRNLLLGRRATIDTKPELEILADDVKCSHGATVGDLDEESLFYLRARGIPEARGAPHAYRGFRPEALERVEDPALREHLHRVSPAPGDIGGAHEANAPTFENGPARRRLDPRASSATSRSSRAIPVSCSSTPPRARRSRRSVIDEVAEFYRTDYANVHRGVYRLSARSTELSRRRGHDAARSSMPPIRARSSSCAARPRRSTSSPRAGASPI